jgi:ATP-dependent RNA helicase DeaD
MLSQIERATRKKIERMELPSTEDINDKRINRFKQRITDTLATEDLSLFMQLIEQYQNEHNVPGVEIAAALAKLAQGDTPLLIQNRPARNTESRRHDDTDDYRDNDRGGHGRDHAPGKRDIRDEISAQDLVTSEQGMERYRIQVGRKHKVKPGNIVGAIANEAELDSKYIGRIDIFDYFSLVDLPEGMPKEVFNQLKKVWVSGQQLNISRADDKSGSRPGEKSSKKKPKGNASKTDKRNKKRTTDRKNPANKNTGHKNTDKKNTRK